ncbi:MAG: sigma-70 family RNA polymerase sigma factor [Bacteroidota bacterium]
MNQPAFSNLVQQIRDGDGKAMSYVFGESSQYCIRTLIKKTNCDMADAEDIYMDAILIFRENILSGKLKELTNIRTYLFGICWNLWRDFNRKQIKSRKEENEVERQFQLLHEGELEDDAREVIQQKIKLVTMGLQALTDKCRQLLTYVYVEKRPQKEIAERMGFASAGVVKVSRHRCYQQWVKKIEQLQTQLNG